MIRLASYLCPFLLLSPIPLYRFHTSTLSSTLPLSFQFLGRHRLSLLFTKYRLTKKKWDFLLIEDQSGKVSSSKPALLLVALKNRGKHQFLTHQWRLPNQLKKTLVWGCKSYLCLIRAFRRCMSGFNVTK